MVVVGDKTITEYGLSMYGGWYANYKDNNTGHYDGYHARTLKDLCLQIGISNTALKRDVVRWDN